VARSPRNCSPRNRCALLSHAGRPISWPRRVSLLPGHDLAIELRSFSPYRGECLPPGAPRVCISCVSHPSLSASYYCFASVCTDFCRFLCDRLLEATQDISDQCKILYWFSRPSAYSKETTPFSLEQIYSQFFLREGQVHTRNIQVWVHQGLSVCLTKRTISTVTI
jgi:hypothetical protein